MQDQDVPVITFTARELDVARLLCAGIYNRHIGDALFIGEGTVRHHIRNIFAKLGVDSRVSAAIWFAQNMPHLLEPE